MKIPFAGHCLISDVPGDKMILICRLKNCFMVYALYFYIHASNF